MKLVNFFSLKVCLKVWISPIKANERTILQCAPIFCVLNKLLNLKSLKCWGVTFWNKIESTKMFEKIKKRNAPGEARTHGLQIMRLTRCLLRYRGCMKRDMLLLVSARFFLYWNQKRELRRPGIEPGSTAWKAAMLTTIPPTLDIKYIKFVKLLFRFWRKFK